MSYSLGMYKLIYPCYIITIRQLSKLGLTHKPDPREKSARIVINTEHSRCSSHYKTPRSGNPLRFYAMRPSKLYFMVTAVACCRRRCWIVRSPTLYFRIAPFFLHWSQYTGQNSITTCDSCWSSKRRIPDELLSKLTLGDSYQLSSSG